MNTSVSMLKHWMY